MIDSSKDLSAKRRRESSLGRWMTRCHTPSTLSSCSFSQHDATVPASTWLSPPMTSSSPLQLITVSDQTCTLTVSQHNAAPFLHRSLVQQQLNKKKNDLTSAMLVHLNWMEDGLQHGENIAEEEVPGLSQRVEQLLTCISRITHDT